MTIPAASPAPYAPPPAPNGDYPGKTMGLVALILAIFLNIVGGIVGIVALLKSKKAGHKNPLALAAIIVGFALFVILATIGIVAGIAVAAFTADLLAQCEGLTGQEIVIDGAPVVCP